jgi:hypothetical protein
MSPLASLAPFVPAKAGTQQTCGAHRKNWMPASAGMSGICRTGGEE